MTALGKETMEKWKAEGQRVVVYYQSGQGTEGVLVDYDDTEIVLEETYKRPARIERRICHNWFYVKEVFKGPIHD